MKVATNSPTNACTGTSAEDTTLPITPPPRGVLVEEAADSPVWERFRAIHKWSPPSNKLWRVAECRFGGGSQQLLTTSRSEGRSAPCEGPAQCTLPQQLRIPVPSTTQTTFLSKLCIAPFMLHCTIRSTIRAFAPGSLSGQLNSLGCSGIRPMNTFDPYIAAERARETNRRWIAHKER